MSKHTHSIDRKILNRIRSHGKGWVFTPSHFEDVSGRSTVSTVLHRLCEAGTIRRLARGLYDYPKADPMIGVLEPSVDNIATALAGRDEIRLQPTGAHAANLLGLSTQVPMQVVYLTEGSARTIQVGKQKITLKKTTPRIMATAGKTSGLVIQALKYLGRDRVDHQVVSTLENRLDDADRRQLMKDINSAPSWIRDIIRNIAAKGGSE